MPFVDQILQKLTQIDGLYHRLIMLVGPANSGKTQILYELGERTASQLINVNLEMTRQMLELTERQRVLRLPKLLDVIISKASTRTNTLESQIVVLDNIELLFGPALKQDPLKLLQSISRSNTLVVAWNGSIDKNTLLYAVPSHPEYRRYPIQDFLVVDTTNAS